MDHLTASEMNAMSRVAPMTEEKMRIGSLIEALAMTVGDMEDRLQSVLEPERPMEVAVSSPDARPPSAPLTSEMREWGDKLDTTLLRLRRLIERVEA